MLAAVPHVSVLIVLCVGQQARQDGQQINVAAIMDTWTLQMGFPVIRLTVSANGKVTATQKRFLINPAAKDPGRFQSPFK